MSAASEKSAGEPQIPVIAQGVADEGGSANTRNLGGWQKHLLFWACVGYAVFHLLVLNLFPIETWAFRILHVAGALAIGFALSAAWSTAAEEGGRPMIPPIQLAPAVVGIGLGVYALGCALYAWGLIDLAGERRPPAWVWAYFGPALTASVVVAMLGSWLFKPQGQRIDWYDWVLAAAAVSVCLYLLLNLNALQFRAGVMPQAPDFWAALAGILLILELTRRLAGMALVVIALVFMGYAFVGPWLPGFLNHSGYRTDRFFTYLYTDNGILGPTTAVSSTYIMLFIAFAAFLQASRVGDYFVNFAFAAAGRARGGPAKVAILASGLMGMINGTSAGNVVATGSLTIPLMKRVGYRPQAAASVEAAASTGGQIMPPIMGAGAFIMAEITGIPYTELMVAALIPALLYFASVLFIVDFEAQRLGMKGLPGSELPKVREMLKQVYLFIPIVILIGALFMGYSVIRAGTLALASAAVVSWLTPHKMGPRAFLNAFEGTTKMALQLIAVCACAGVIVGVIGLTGVGLRFSSMLLRVAEHSQLIALVFAMVISIVLGMGMPTTAAYAVAASVVAPGLIQLEIPVLIAHFFVFYYAVISAITPPVALAAYAGAAIAGSEPMRTSVTAFRFGLAAFIVPFMFFYSPGLLMEAEWHIVLRNVVTASIGVYLLAGSIIGFFHGHLKRPVRALLLVAAVAMIAGGIYSDGVGIGLGLAIFLFQKRFASVQPLRTEAAG